MRAARYWVVLALACGGRTFDDGSYDEAAGGSGGAGTGASNTGARGGTTPEPGRPPDPGGAAAGAGGSTGVGGSSGNAGPGAPAGGGAIGGAGQTGSGGAAIVNECTSYCKGYSLACFDGLDWDNCMATCSSALATSGDCFAVTVRSLRCVSENLRHVPSDSCELALTTAAGRCQSAIDASQRCLDGSCATSISTMGNTCWITHRCPDHAYETRCINDNDSVECVCSRDGVPQQGISWSSNQDEPCSMPEVLALCGVFDP